MKKIFILIFSIALALANPENDNVFEGHVDGAIEDIIDYLLGDLGAPSSPLRSTKDQDLLSNSIDRSRSDSSDSIYPSIDSDSFDSIDGGIDSDSRSDSNSGSFDSTDTWIDSYSRNDLETSPRARIVSIENLADIDRVLPQSKSSDEMIREAARALMHLKSSTEARKRPIMQDYWSFTKKMKLDPRPRSDNRIIQNII